MAPPASEPIQQERKRMGLYAAAGAVLIGLAVALGSKSSSSRLDALERRILATQRELDRTKHKLEETTRAFEAYREQHAIVVTDESLQEEVRRALDVVAKTTKASEARQNATAEVLVRTVHADVDRQTAADEQKTSLSSSGTTPIGYGGQSSSILHWIRLNRICSPRHKKLPTDP